MDKATYFPEVHLYLRDILRFHSVNPTSQMNSHPSVSTTDSV